MIKIKFKDAENFYDLDESMESALKYIVENPNLANLENGRYEINGDNVFAIVSDYQTKPLSEGRWEAHKKYIDIQCVIKGREKMGWGLLENFSPVTEYDEEKDIYFFEGEKGYFEELKEGYMAIITPENVHMPSISVSKKQEYVKKIVVKVKDRREDW